MLFSPLIQGLIPPLTPRRQCLDANRQPILCLVRIRFMILEGGQYSTLVCSFIALPVPDLPSLILFTIESSDGEPPSPKRYR
jgi:hypothetical protein